MLDLIALLTGQAAEIALTKPKEALAPVPTPIPLNAPPTGGNSKKGWTYQSETEFNINVSCDFCDRRLKIQRSICIAEGEGFIIVPPGAKCSCGHIATKIKPEGEQLRPFIQSTTPTNPTPNSQPPKSVSCPKCKSEQVTPMSKGFGLGKAAVGGLALGAVGLLAGVIGSKKLMIACMNCGHKWQAGR